MGKLSGQISDYHRCQRSCWYRGRPQRGCSMQEGANLMLVDVDEAPLAALANELGAAYMAADVSQDDANRDIVAATLDALR